MDIDGTRPQGRQRMQRSVDGVRTSPARLRAETHTSLPKNRSHQGRAVANKDLHERKAYPLPKYYAPERPVKIVRKRLSKKMLVVRSAGVLTVLVMGLGGFFSWKAYSKFHKV